MDTDEHGYLQDRKGQAPSATKQDGLAKENRAIKRFTESRIRHEKKFDKAAPFARNNEEHRAVGRFKTKLAGETVAAGFLEAMNDPSPYQGRKELVILGDPTLRFQVAAPATNLLASYSQSNVILTWTASPEIGAQYFVYRSPNIDSAFTNRLTAGAISLTTFTDTNAPAGQKIYQVRALKTANTASGSYTNLSQGIFVPIN